MKTTSCILIAALLLGLSSTVYGKGGVGVPSAALPINPLAALGPISTTAGAGLGFPTYVQDTKGLALKIGLQGDGVNGPGVFVPPDPANPASVAAGFGAEAFVYYLDSSFTMPNGGNARVRMGVEASWVNGVPTAGQETLFTRVLCRVDCPVAGTYTITHPYGVETFTVTTPGLRAINSQIDVLALGPNFAPVLQGNVGPFCTVVPAPAPTATGTFIGTPALTNQVITGSPYLTNFVRIDGPVGSGLGGPGIDFVQNNGFAVAGEVFTAAPVAPGVPPAPVVLPTAITSPRATYSRAKGIVTVDVFVSSAPNATVTVDVGPKVGLPATGDGTGNFLVHTTFPLAATAVLPTTATIHAVAAPNTPNTATATLTDLVTVTLAQYTRSTKVLQVQAVSSDTVKKPVLTLTLPLLGPLTAQGRFQQALVTVPPTAVTVSSAAGGSGTATVVVK